MLVDRLASHSHRTRSARETKLLKPLGTKFHGSFTEASPACETAQSIYRICVNRRRWQLGLDAVSRVATDRETEPLNHQGCIESFMEASSSCLPVVSSPTKVL